MCHWPKWYHVLNWFFEIYLNFEWYKSFINQYLPHSESKSYHKNFINCTHQDLSNNTKSTFQFFQKIQLQFIFYWKNHWILKNFYTRNPNVMELSPCTPTRQKLSKDIKNMIWSILVWWISYLQNKIKQITFFHR